MQSAGKNSVVEYLKHFPGPFPSRYPLIATSLASFLVNNTALFAASNLDDPDFRQIWQVIKDRLRGLPRPAYVTRIAARPNASESPGGIP
jgi:hypothetical protein